MVSSLERVLAFLGGPVFFAYASCTSTSAEASVETVKLQPLIFLLNLHFYISLIYAACAGNSGGAGNLPLLQPLKSRSGAVC